MIEGAAVTTRLGLERVGTEHLVMALADQSAPVRESLIRLGIDPDLVPTTSTALGAPLAATVLRAPGSYVSADSAASFIP
jgi:hypothetical protein